MEIRQFDNCCGAGIMYGFYNGPVPEIIEKEFLTRLRLCRTVYNWGSVTIYIKASQEFHWKKILRANGFEKCIKASFTNPNTGNDIVQYFCVFDKKKPKKVSKVKSVLGKWK